MTIIQRLYSTMFILAFLAIFVLNSFIFKQPIVGGILLVVYLVWVGLQLGAIFARRDEHIMNWWIGIWILFSIIMIVGSIAYYVFSMPAELFQIIVLISPTLVVFSKRFVPKKSWFETLHFLWREKRHNISSQVWIACAIVIVLFVEIFHIINANAIFDAVRSPWEKVPFVILVLFALCALIIFALLYRGREHVFSIPLFIALLATALFFGAIVFPLGFGFDSFIHKATENHLTIFGTISPKPFYYIGQYSLVLFFTHAFSIPVNLVDTWLVPFLAALLLPFAWLFASAHMNKTPKTSLFALMGIFLIPLSSFIVTTPQGLANLWILLTILFSIPLLLDKENTNWFVFILVSIATILIHPIAGFPVLFFVLLLFLETKSKCKSGRVAFWICFALACSVLPASFIGSSIVSHQPININFAGLNPINILNSLNLNVFFENRFSPLLDLVYLIGKNFMTILILLSGFALWTYRKDLSKRFMISVLMVVALFINYLLLANTINFSFLIDYERMNYADRLIPLIAFFLTPLLILSLSHISINIRTRPIILKLTVLILFVAIATSSFYVLYPRRDAYETSHGFNVSQSDIDAVYLTDDWAQNKPYLVLANQSVSAAAMQQLGFRYFGNQFFYPIPTGEAMYQKFLDMNSNPNKKTIDESVALVLESSEQPEIVFYIVDSYWWNAQKIIEQSKVIADDWKAVGDGDVYVFRFAQK